MIILPFPYSYVPDNQLDQDSLLVRFIKSRVVATCMLLIACLQPVEVFASSVPAPLQCQLTGMVCTDSTPCKIVNGGTVCLSTVSPLPPGALRSSQPCWKSTGTYLCTGGPNATTTDTCGPYATNKSCGQTGSTCISKDVNGNCNSSSVTYQCQTGGGGSATGTAANCTGTTICTGGVCYTKDAPNNTLVKVVTAAEVTRQAGFYMSGNPPTIFGGQAGWCTQDNLGLANCCKPNPKGASYTDALIAQQLIAGGWNQWVGPYIGSSYTFDTLFTDATTLAQSALNGMTTVVNWAEQATGWSAGAAPVLQTAAPAVAGAPAAVGAAGQGPTGVVTNAGSAFGGYVGGMAGQYAGTALFANNGANTGFTGVGGALGYAAGATAGTYVGGGAYAVATNGATGTATFSGSGAAAICTPCIVAMLVVMIIMAFLACDVTEIKTTLKMGAGICHYGGSYCSANFLGSCVTTRQNYCCFNSKLALIIQEQGRPQIGKPWGSPQALDCSGYTIPQLGTLDFSKMDFSAFYASVVAQATPDANAIAANAAAQTKAFYASQANPSLTMGIMPPPIAGVPTPATITAINPLPVTPMAACNTTVTRFAQAANGDQPGMVSVSACNPNFTASFVYTGTCGVMQTNTATDVPLDANGNGVFNTTVPGACMSQTNVWIARIINPANIDMSGKITVQW